MLVAECPDIRLRLVLALVWVVVVELVLLVNVRPSTSRPTSYADLRCRRAFELFRSISAVISPIDEAGRWVDEFFNGTGGGGLDMASSSLLAFSSAFIRFKRLSIRLT